MSVIVTDRGFAAEDFGAEIIPLDAIEGRNDIAAVDLPPTADPLALRDLLPGLKLIRVAFPAFSDGRGFTVARRLRAMGYAGRLRAAGHVLADQYTMARRVGFDEVEISDDLAARQPADQWAFRTDWKAHDYQSRLRARLAGSAAAPDIVEGA
ncbi:DUF934 domain-containing protein [Ruixingdingia sedimenti]|uniref:DUF934 domain-containing protein n=1 Tax=Ruixingdingia sedimenti TaxID=3073604 RepID=A0ABU1FBG4_9RHOB|nr:DUF934 domain-containing protein [Xinfangfangia sp. LG-4]MDR5653784.1 DUF934 domain-containing protein [Xinfangfangia sp. LG-4]